MLMLRASDALMQTSRSGGVAAYPGTSENAHKNRTPQHVIMPLCRGGASGRERYLDFTVYEKTEGVLVERNAIGRGHLTGVQAQRHPRKQASSWNKIKTCR